MKRALRRHQQRVAKFRRARILMSYWGWTWYVDRWTPHKAKHGWAQINRLVMNEPGWWVREMMTRTARVRARQILKLIENGMDPDLFQFPDNRKPHVYYW